MLLRRVSSINASHIGPTASSTQASLCSLTRMAFWKSVLARHRRWCRGKCSGGRVADSLCKALRPKFTLVQQVSPNEMPNRHAINKSQTNHAMSSILGSVPLQKDVPLIGISETNRAKYFAIRWTFMLATLWRSVRGSICSCTAVLRQLTYRLPRSVSCVVLHADLRSAPRPDSRGPSSWR